jgi:hypothetical protein
MRQSFAGCGEPVGSPQPVYQQKLEDHCLDRLPGFFHPIALEQVKFVMIIGFAHKVVICRVYYTSFVIGRKLYYGFKFYSYFILTFIVIWLTFGIFTEK